MTTPNPELLDDEILAAGSVDYLDLWFITNIVRRLTPSSDENDIRRISIETLERLLESGRVRAGDLYPPGDFSPWPFETSEALERIRHELDELHRDLQPGN